MFDKSDYTPLNADTYTPLTEDVICNLVERIRCQEDSAWFKHQQGVRSRWRDGSYAS